MLHIMCQIIILIKYVVHHTSRNKYIKCTYNNDDEIMKLINKNCENCKEYLSCVKNF